jgi:hypothetical protein
MAAQSVGGDVSMFGFGTGEPTCEVGGDCCIAERRRQSTGVWALPTGAYPCGVARQQPQGYFGGCSRAFFQRGAAESALPSFLLAAGGLSHSRLGSSGTAAT